MSVVPWLRQRHAIATFNVLSSEDRAVVAALISETPVTRAEACYYTAQPVAKKRYTLGTALTGSAGSAGDDSTGSHKPPLLP